MTVSPELHAKVLKRDGRCFMFRVPAEEPDDPHRTPFTKTGDRHVCFGHMSVDHVHLIPGGVRGKRAPDDEQHLVAMCSGANVAGPSRTVREAEREYLRGLYPECA